MEVKKIYLDMDGVLADFESAVIAFGATQFPIGDEMWNKLKNTPNFFKTIKPLKNSHFLFNLLYSFHKDKVEILTGIPQPKREMFSAAKDKEDWIREHFSKIIKVNAVFRKDKKDFCHGEQYILIDDMKRNIKEWKKQGGIGILHTSVEDTINQLKQLGVV